MPKGNADRSGKVEAGDQLAAINGRTSIGMKVDDICEAISDASAKSNGIELTFLRYIGPFRPLASDGDRASHVSNGRMYPEDQSLLEDDEKPRSTMSITRPNEKASINEIPSKSSKRGGFRKKFKWLSRGRKQQTKKSE